MTKSSPLTYERKEDVLEIYGKIRRTTKVCRSGMHNERL